MSGVSAFDRVRKECAGCGSDRIQMLNHTETCMACLERGVEMFGAPDRLKSLAEMLVYGTVKGSMTRDELETLRGELVAVANRLVVLSRETERTQQRLAKEAICGL